MQRYLHRSLNGAEDRQKTGVLCMCMCALSFRRHRHDQLGAPCGGYPAENTTYDVNQSAMD